MRRHAIIALGVLLAVSACNQSSDVNNDIELYLDGGFGPPDQVNNNDAGPGGATSSMYPAFSPDVPQVVDLSGPILPNPVIVPVFFANDDMSSVSTLTGFDDSIGQSSYWASAVGEYGVGPATATAVYMSSESLTGTITDSQIQGWIQTTIVNDPTFPRPTAETIYVMHYPAEVTIALPEGPNENYYSCDEIGGYHSEVALSDSDAADGGFPAYVAYAVIPRCTEFNDLQGIDSTTAAESHELAEASTDPLPGVDTAYGAIDEAHFAWEILFGTEVGDMCAQDLQAYFQPAGFPYTVQRIWSNASASQGHDPCVPYLPNEVYYNSMPVLSDTATLTIDSEMASVESFNVAQGSTGMMSLNLFSDGPMSQPWGVQVIDLGEAEDSPASTTFSLTSNEGFNGNTLPMTVSAVAAPPFGNVDIFYVISSASDGTSHYWIGSIGEF